MRLLDRLFGHKKKEEPILVPPIIGGTYVLRDNDDKNPFEDPIITTVINVKRGYVQYFMGNGPFTWSLPCERFTRIYKKL